MVGYNGEKMSKSLGNLVFVRDLLNEVPAAVIRLLLSAHHHRAAWEYDRGELAGAHARWDTYRAAIDTTSRFSAADAQAVRDGFMSRIDDDVDTPGALAILDDLAGHSVQSGPRGVGDVTRAQLMAPLLDVLGAPLTAG